MIIVIVEIAVLIGLGFLAGPSVIYVFNHMPATWLCDYNEEPKDNPLFSEELGSESYKRIKENPWRWVYSAGFICLVLRIWLIELRDGLFETDWQGSLVYGQLAFAGLIICWLLLVISLADLKYLIIPDQFIIMLALSGIGFMPIYSRFAGLQSGGMDQVGSLFGGDKAGFWQALVGMLIGMAVMLLVALLGRLLLKTEAVGFGDVKLSGAIGLVVGINGIIPILVGAFLFSGVYAGLGLITRRLKGSDVIAFGPFLCGATMAYILVLLPLM